MVQFKEKNAGDVAHRQGFLTLKWAILTPTLGAARQFRLTSLKTPHWWPTKLIIFALWGQNCYVAQPYS